VSGAGNDCFLSNKGCNSVNAVSSNRCDIVSCLEFFFLIIIPFFKAILIKRLSKHVHQRREQMGLQVSLMFPQKSWDAFRHRVNNFKSRLPCGIFERLILNDLRDNENELRHHCGPDLSMCLGQLDHAL
jgi:hypothetical protein